MRGSAKRSSVKREMSTSGTTWEHRFQEVLALFSGGRKAPIDMIERWFGSDDEGLQQWVSEHGALGWHQGIILIEAAELIADNPAEGEGHAPRSGTLTAS